MRLNKHKKKGCEKVVDSNGKQLNFKLYPPLQNVTKGFIFTKGGKVLEYCMKLDSSSKPRSVAL
jgi:hypothetical protein